MSLSDLIQNPACFVNNFSETNNDDELEYVKNYGIGIDCHSQFIEICIGYRQEQFIKKAQGHFSTDWTFLERAMDWCMEVLRNITNSYLGTILLEFFYIYYNFSADCNFRTIIIQASDNM